LRWRQQVEEAKINEARLRGDAARQTSDARFDASFQLASGLQQAASQAWYVQRSVASGGPTREETGRGLILLQQQQQRYLGGISVTSSTKVVRASKESSKKARKRESEHREGGKHRRHKKSKDRDGSRSLSESSGGVAKRSIEELRESRLLREAAERRRAAQAQVGRIL
jgi:hypothetical protein